MALIDQIRADEKKWGGFAQNIPIPTVGTLVAYRGKTWEILSTVTYQEKIGQNVTYGTMMTILAVDDEGEDLGEEPIQVNTECVDTI